MMLLRKSNGLSFLASRVLLPLAILISVINMSACTPKPVIIGFVGPLTGSSSAVGLSGRNGFLMAFGDGKGSAPGKIPPIKLIVKDDHSDPDVCLNAFLELQKEGCSIVVLGSTSNAAVKALPWAMQNGIFVISPTVSSIKIAGKDSLFVRVNTASEEYGVYIARLAYERYGKKKVGVIGDERNKNYVDAVREAFTDRYEGLGGHVAFSMSFDSKAGNPASELSSAVRESGCDGLFIIAASTDVVLMAKELEKNGQKPQIFLPPWPLTLDLLHNGGKAVEGVLAISVADLEFRSPEGKVFESAYLEEFGEEPSFTAMFGYEASSILRLLLSSTRNLDPPSLRQSIIAHRDYEGLQGLIRFNKAAEAEREMILFTVKNGAYKRVE